MGKKHKDPITGDELTAVEWISWHIQSMVRSPWFIVVFNLITLAAMLLAQGEIWNYFASWLAIMIEWIVGKYMFGQTGRDAKIIRHLEQQTAHIERIAEHIQGLTTHDPERS